jgi:iron(III) transport system substrate-binding protein
LTAIEEHLAGLDPVARESRLVELAQAEQGVTTLYASMLLADTEVVVSEFREKYGLEVEIFRANSGQVLQRVLQESQADFSGADVVLTGALELAVLADESLLLPLVTPTTADIVDGAVFETWAGVYIQTFVSAWNTDTLEPSSIPSSWEEVLTQYPKGLAMELGDWDWFATLVQDYFVGELGYSEAGAIDLFRKAAGAATIVRPSSHSCFGRTAPVFTVTRIRRPPRSFWSSSSSPTPNPPSLTSDGHPPTRRSRVACRQHMTSSHSMSRV